MTSTLRALIVASGFGAVALAGSAMAQDVKPEAVAFSDSGGIETPVAAQAGSAEAGQKVLTDRKLGNCVACHQVSTLDAPFQGNVGPSLDGVGDRYEPDMLRAIVVNPKKALYDGTIMPGFYTLDVGKHVREDLVGKTILSAQQVEDVVAYLQTLKE
ncbi:sulfur oxidation c-type cytochrome SoxX [Notoacmeibacter sp. MSK16QG-6]|uniref:sulfur oxidation c-type cytochrome SoxX n=1 Tax=Notoacmeibacter sp. MSK16QG-6 TaxID=2957982 RepID=UPI0020A22EDF|nr:sulfur oxidation c-type cytochrome SoxX [Notoacmeibacter sp. MSK16QG-6]MCP1200812.1 sulfur oxidation c-type cytochrome SoxX [Notoacmeibacter sp. MSK16QG-6]